MANIRLAQLAAQATLDASKYAEGARQVDAANKQMQQGQAAVGQAMSQTQARAADSSRAFDKYRQSLDVTFRSQQQLENGQRRIQAAYQKGQITLEEQIRLMNLLNAKYTEQGAAQAAAAAAATASAAAWKSWGLAIGAVAVALAAREYIQFADTMSTVGARLKIVAGTTADAAIAQRELLDIAQRTRTEFESNITLYTRLGRSADELHLSQRNVFDVTELVQKSLKLSGATTQEASSTVVQLSQALGAGVLRGQDFKSVMEQGGRIARALADGLHLPIGALRDMAEQGKLTSDVVIKSLLSQKDVIDREFKTLPLTVGDALTSVHNDMLSFVGDVDKASGLSKQLAKDVQSFGDVLKDPDVIKAGALIVEGLAASFTFIGTAIAGDIKLVTDLVTELGKVSGASDYSKTMERVIGDAGNTTYADMLGGNRTARPTSSPIESVRVSSDAATIGKLQADINAQLDAEKKKREEIAKETALADSKRANNLEKYIRGLEGEAKITTSNVDAREQEAAVLRAQEMNVVRITDATGKQVEYVRQLSDLDAGRIRAAVAQRQVLEEQQKQLDEQKEKAEAWVKDVTGSASDLIASVFERGSQGAKEWLGHLKTWFFQLLADMAAKALVSPIIVPVVTSILGAGAGASLSGALGGGSGGGLGGLGNLFGGGAGSSITGGIDSIGKMLGLQSFGGVSGGSGLGSAARAALGESQSLGAGLFGTSTTLSGALGGGLAGVGLGATAGALTGGNQIGSSIGGLVGGIAGSFLGPIGTMVGGALGGIIGGMFGPGPSNNTATASFDTFGNFKLGGDEANQNTSGLAQKAASSISGTLAALQQGGGVTLTQQLQSIAIGERDKSAFQLVGGKTVRTGGPGDADALALAVVKALSSTASYKNPYIEQVVKGNKFGSTDELVKAVTFTRDVYTTIANAERPLSQVQQEMKNLTDNFTAARKQAEQLGLSLDKFDAGAAKSFNQTIEDQIKAITDPVGAALDQIDRDAQARVDTAKKLGGDLVEVEKLTALQRTQVLTQVNQAQVQSFAGLKSLIDDVAFGQYSAAAPEQQYFSALTRYNTSRRAALDTQSPDAIADFESSSRALLPIARSFLGTSQQYGALEAGIVDTARTLGGSYADPAQIGAAIVTATNASGAAIVDQLKALQSTIEEQNAIIARQNAQIQALLARAA